MHHVGQGRQLSEKLTVAGACLFLLARILYGKGIARQGGAVKSGICRDRTDAVIEGMRFVTFVKSNAKALLTLRIKGAFAYHRCELIKGNFVDDSNGFLLMFHI